MLAVGVMTGGATLFVAWQYPSSPHETLITSAIESLSSCDYEARDQAAQTLKQLGPETVPYLTRALSRHESIWSRYLERLPLVPRNPRNLASTRERAAEQLACVAPQDPRAIQALIRALRDENMEVQRALRKIGPSEYITAALHDRDPRVRRGVAEVMGDLGPRAIASVPALAHALNDREEFVRGGVARALGTIRAPSAIKPLTAALNDPTPSVRAAAAESLGEIRGRESLAALTEKLSDADSGVRVKAAQAIWRIDRDAELTVPVLVHALRDRHAGSDAKFVLGEIGPAAKSAVPALVQSLREERVGRPLRTPPSSALALGRIGAPAVPELVPVLKNDHPEVRTSAVIALGFIGKAAHDAAPHLMPLLDDNNLEVRQAAALALGSIEPDNRELVPALKQLARDDDIFLAGAASAMLRNLDPAAALELGLE
ncbi:MAG TPA: HEAT repeat domain-containing protein [Verrucomicrobiae bacterium]|nr:HEAT repeat domain-containing protein [Verrucomicrobiae bacterium]